MTDRERFVRRQNEINRLTLKNAIPLTARKLGITVTEVFNRMYDTVLYADLYDLETDVRYMSYRAIADALAAELRQGGQTASEYRRNTPRRQR